MLKWSGKPPAQTALSGVKHTQGAGTGQAGACVAGGVTITIRKPAPDVVKTRLPTNSRYSYAYKPLVTGKYPVSVAFAPDADHLGSQSARTLAVVGVGEILYQGF